MAFTSPPTAQETMLWARDLRRRHPSLNLPEVPLGGGDMRAWFEDLHSKVPELGLPTTIDESTPGYLRALNALTAHLLDTAALYRVNVGGSGVSGWEDDPAGDLSPYTEAAVDRTEVVLDGAVRGPNVPSSVPVEVLETLRWRGGSSEEYLRFRMRHGAGSHVIRLLFCERDSVGIGGRLFHVDLDGQRVLTNYDVFDRVGVGVGIMEEFVREYDGHGYTVVEFLYADVNTPIVSGIEVIGPPPGPPPAITLEGQPAAGGTTLTLEQ